MTLLDPGRYYARLVGQTIGQNKKGTDVITLNVDVEYWWNETAWVAVPGQESRTIYIYLSEGSWPYAEKKLEALGFNGRFDQDIEFSLKQFEIECNHETYEGKLREKWELVNWGSATELAELPMQSATRYAALWKARAQPRPKPEGHPQSPPPKPPTGKEIPF